MATLIEFSVRIFHPSEFFSVRPRSTFPVELLVPSVVHFSTSLSFRSSWTGHSVGLCGSCEVLVLGVCQSFVLSGESTFGIFCWLSNADVGFFGWGECERVTRHFILFIFILFIFVTCFSKFLFCSI